MPVNPYCPPFAPNDYLGTRLAPRPRWNCFSAVFLMKTMSIGSKAFLLCCGKKRDFLVFLNTMNITSAYLRFFVFELEDCAVSGVEDETVIADYEYQNPCFCSIYPVEVFLAFESYHYVVVRQHQTLGSYPYAAPTSAGHLLLLSAHYLPSLSA